MNDPHPDMSERERTIELFSNIAAEINIMAGDLQFVQMEYHEVQVDEQVPSLVDNEHCRLKCHVPKGKFYSQTLNIKC